MRLSKKLFFSVRKHIKYKFQRKPFMLMVRIRPLGCRIEYRFHLSEIVVIIIPLTYNNADLKMRVTLGDIVHQGQNMIPCHCTLEG